MGDRPALRRDGRPRRLRLWAGAGVVADSDPAAELAETNAKLATMLHALHAIPR
ncbi:chorismate-binding protein [[Actinomadura] parvosata]|uniref:chorismate-binding protein n=1 Tax=[Actinomadura] parvosata TaxID=1955412 RepID=UPI001C90C934